MMASPNFSIREMFVSRSRPELVSRVGEIPWEHLVNVVRLILIVLQPLRDRFGPGVISSGYRSELLQRAVGDEGPSAHREGRAADIAFPGASAAFVWQELRAGYLTIDFDRIAYYPAEGRFHVEVAPPGQEARRLLFLATPTWTQVAIPVA